MPDRAKLLNDLDGLKKYGVLLAVQMGGVPNEIQLLFETAEFDEKAGGLRRLNNYLVRCLGVREHKMSVGVFGRLTFMDDHALLHHHNTPRVAVTFEGIPADLNEASLDILQTYASTYTLWRNMMEMGGDLNNTMPLTELLSKQGDGAKMLGVMPRPLAERMGKVLAHHSLKYELTQDPEWSDTDDHGRSTLSKLLLVDQSYVIALDFSVEQIGKK